MHCVGRTIMADQQISWDDTKESTITNEMIRINVFPFVSYAEFYARGYQMLKEYYVNLPLSQTYPFMGYLMTLWRENKIKRLRDSYRIAHDPIEKNRVYSMSDEEYKEYWHNYFQESHKSIARSRAGFIKHSKMSSQELEGRIAEIDKECKDTVRRLWKEIGWKTHLVYWYRLRSYQLKGLLSAPVVFALIAVSCAEIVKVIVSRLFDVWLKNS